MNATLPEVTTIENKREAMVTLNLVPGIGGTIYQRIEDKFSSPVEFLQRNKEGWQSIKGIGPKLAGQIQDVLEDDEYKKEFEKIQEAGCRVVTREDDAFPTLLDQIHDPPILLYVKGTLEPDNLNIGVVGTRGSTFYGEKQGKRLSTMMSYRGVSVVSGLARGIDTAAHHGTLEAGGHTIAVLGSGIHNVYPADNEELAGRIAEEGALVSELPMDAPPEAQNFPQRNRIIAGLSAGVLVVEAPERSGALITANLALEQNREVFAIPGNIDSPQSYGCNQLIQEGAHCVLHVDDIFDEIQHFSFSESSEESRRDIYSSPEFEEEENRRIFEALEKQTPKSVDDLTQELEMNGSEISSRLTRLEIQEVVQRLPGNRYVQY